METPVTKYTTNSWKDKLRIVQGEKKYLKKKLCRTQSSRDKYKSEIKNLKEVLAHLQEQLSPNLPSPDFLKTKKPKGHSYSLFLIHLAVFPALRDFQFSMCGGLKLS